MKQEVERAPSIERKVFGEYETVTLPASNFVRLPQVRSGINPDLPQLKDSIRHRGLLNPIDVARMDEAEFNAYISFVNRTWKTDVSAVDYAYQQQPDGRYYVVVAGHTRAEAIYQLEEEDEAGYEYSIVAKVHPISSPDEIISLQLDENIHTKPSQERRAISIVETYQYGLEMGSWTNKAEFLRQAQGKFSRQTLNDAMGFAQLPSEARDFVFSGRLSYNAAVALGRASDTILEYVATRLGYDDVPAEVTVEFETAYRQRIGLMIAGIANGSLNGTAAKKYIEGQTNVMAAHIYKQRNPDSEDTLFDFELASPEEQRADYLRQLDREYNAALREMGQRSVDAVSDAIRLHRRLKGGEEDSRLEVERQKRTALLAGQAIDFTQNNV